MRASSRRQAGPPHWLAVRGRAAGHRLATRPSRTARHGGRRCARFLGSDHRAPRSASGPPSTPMLCGTERRPRQASLRNTSSSVSHARSSSGRTLSRVTPRTPLTSTRRTSLRTPPESGAPTTASPHRRNDPQPTTTSWRADTRGISLLSPAPTIDARPWPSSTERRVANVSLRRRRAGSERAAGAVVLRCRGRDLVGLARGTRRAMSASTRGCRARGRDPRSAGRSLHDR
ncbi:MAG: hypothetical protein QOI08_3436 [Actinomycetota bacterium]|nr:hypothetical protein [Actinomycetota bacterium]